MSGAGSLARAFWLLDLASSLAVEPWAVGAGQGPEPAWLWGLLEGCEGCLRRPSPLDECLLRPPSSMGGCSQRGESETVRTITEPCQEKLDSEISNKLEYHSIVSLILMQKYLRELDLMTQIR